MNYEVFCVQVYFATVLNYVLMNQFVGNNLGPF